MIPTKYANMRAGQALRHVKKLAYEYKTRYDNKSNYLDSMRIFIHSRGLIYRIEKAEVNHIKSVNRYEELHRYE